MMHGQLNAINIIILCVLDRSLDDTTTLLCCNGYRSSGWLFTPEHYVIISELLNLIHAHLKLVCPSSISPFKRNAYSLATNTILMQYVLV